MTQKQNLSNYYGTPFVEMAFKKRECRHYIPQTKERDGSCSCGLRLDQHHFLGGGVHEQTERRGTKGGATNYQRVWRNKTKILMNLKNCSNEFNNNNGSSGEHWQASKHTTVSPTNAYGTLEFQGGAHPIKAQYVRLSYDTGPDKVFELLSKEWKLGLPKLLMSIHGGKANFELQPKLKKVIQSGLLKAAKTTGAWIFTGGTNSGVIKHVGETFKNERSQTLRGHVVTIGIAPWGIIEDRENLVGKNVSVAYHSISSPKSKFAVLNDRHAYFLLVDDGTVGKYGNEIGFRKKLEKYISKQTIFTSQPSRSSIFVPNSGNGTVPRSPMAESKPYGIPVVGVVIEGGANTIRCVLEYVTDTPPVPVVVCDGSGRAADLIAFAHKKALDDGTLPINLQENLLSTIESVFDCTPKEATALFAELMQCVKRKELITVFRMGEGPCNELDQAILTSLLKGSRLSPADQLSLALTWNRVDIASSEIFVYGKELPYEMLEQAMMDSLACDSVDFVKLLLENGVNMSKFLTVTRLEELYNTKLGPSNTLRYLVRDITKHGSLNQRVTLPIIGMVVERLMGGVYRCGYRKRDFRLIYDSLTKREISHLVGKGHDNCSYDSKTDEFTNIVMFPFPYNELLVWAVLMNRQKMALYMWEKGEEAMAKALIAIKLYKGMAQEAAQDDLEADVSDEMRRNSKEFEQLSLDILDYCYRQNDTIAQQILTYELQNWSKQTCLTLAVSANHREFMAHPCCQILLADLWMGGLRTRKSTNLKVLLGLVCPPFILTLEFKSKDELKLMPQTEEEHKGNHEDDASECDSSVLDVEGGVSKDSRRAILLRARRMANGHINPGYPKQLYGSEKRKERSLRLGKKIYEFYTAPLTKFLGHSITYFLFLCLFTYLAVVRTPVQPTGFEIFCLIYILTLCMEKVREIISTEPVRLSHKIVVWMDNKWNPCDVVAIFIYVSAFMVRLWPNPENLEIARILYACDIMYWYLRILHILSVNKYLGPYVTMMGKMIIQMLYFVLLLLVVLMAFGVARQAILNPYEDPNWNLARDIFFKPYFMLYGEVFADSIDPPCGDGPDLNPCRVGRWVSIVAMCLYLLVANILLINLLIAVFNNIFLSVDAVAQQVWKSKRYSVVMEYEQKPVLPPPLIVINHAVMIFNRVLRQFGGKKKNDGHVLKLFLTEKELEDLYDFEEECVDGYFREKDSRMKSSPEELIKASNLRIDYLTQRMEDLYQRSTSSLAAIRKLNFGVEELTEETKKTSSYLAVIHRYMMTASGQTSPDNVDLQPPEIASCNEDEVDFRFPGQGFRSTGDRQDDHLALAPDEVLGDRSNVASSTSSSSSSGRSSSSSESPNSMDVSKPVRHPAVSMPDTFDQITVGSTESGLEDFRPQASEFYRKMAVGRACRRQLKRSSRKQAVARSLSPLDTTTATPSSVCSEQPEEKKLDDDPGTKEEDTLFATSRNRYPSERSATTNDTAVSDGSKVRRRRHRPPLVRLNSRSSMSTTGNVHSGVAAPSIQVFPPTPPARVQVNRRASISVNAGGSGDLHEYTSIMDDIESRDIFVVKSPTGSLSGGVAGGGGGSANVGLSRRRSSCSAAAVTASYAMSDGMSDAENAILAKEEALRAAEKQDYRRMEKLVVRRIHRDSENLDKSCDELSSLGSSRAPGVPLSSPTPSRCEEEHAQVQVEHSEVAGSDTLQPPDSQDRVHEDGLQLCHLAVVAGDGEVRGSSEAEDQIEHMV